MSDKALIFSAPSGSGKTTIVRHLLTQFPELCFSVSATTREKRYYEIDKKDYYFLTPEVFNAKIESNEFIEWEEVYSGSKYGTLKSEVERIWSESKVVVFDVEVYGAVNLKKIFGEKALAVFIKVKDLDTLRTRLEARGTESKESLQKRLDKASVEMKFEAEFDKVIVNDTLEHALQEAEETVENFLRS